LGWVVRERAESIYGYGKLMPAVVWKTNGETYSVINVKYVNGDVVGYNMKGMENSPHKQGRQV